MRNSRIKNMENKNSTPVESLTDEKRRLEGVIVDNSGVARKELEIKEHKELVSEYDSLKHAPAESVTEAFDACVSAREELNAESKTCSSVCAEANKVIESAREARATSEESAYEIYQKALITSREEFDEISKAQGVVMADATKAESVKTVADLEATKALRSSGYTMSKDRSAPVPQGTMGTVHGVEGYKVTGKLARPTITKFASVKLELERATNNAIFGITSSVEGADDHTTAFQTKVDELLAE